MNLIFTLILSLFLYPLLSNGQQSHFNHTIMEVSGDLNKDNLPDKAIVLQDTLNRDHPYKLQVFFKKPDGKFKLIIESTKAIEPYIPSNHDGYSFDRITIKKGILSIECSLLRGHYAHKFRYQNENFELIGFSNGGSDGRGTVSTVDFNLSTGIRIEKSERYDIDKKLTNHTKKVLIRPLPKLQDIVPLENEYY